MKTFNNSSITKTLIFTFIILIGNKFSTAQDAKKRLPIIDVHVHAMKVNPNFSSEMCP